jgi:hypothetical protein
MKVIFTTLFFVFTTISFNLFSQQKQYYSKSNSITIANGTVTQVSRNKSMYIAIHRSDYANKGLVLIQDIPFNSDSGNRNHFESFDIYSIKLNDNGLYYYWTKDIAQDGQTVLFEVDMNSAIPKIVMSRYSPNGGNKVLKRIEFYIE